MGFVDLHSHVLPGLDDGVKALVESLELTSLLGKMGFEIVCATPHQKTGQFLPSREAIDQAYATVKAALAERAGSVTLYLGAENFWDELFLTRWPKGEQPRYTGGKAFLFEIHPQMAPPRLEETLFQIRLGGLVPAMAHPERYQPFWGRNWERYEAIARTCAMVVDLGALDGAHGKEECKNARKLVEDGLAHAAATDVHSVVDARAAGAGMAWIKKRCGDAVLQRLLVENPRRILNGEFPD